MAFFLHLNRFPFSLTFVYTHSSPDILKNNLKDDDLGALERSGESILKWVTEEITDIHSYDESKQTIINDSIRLLYKGIFTILSSYSKEKDEIPIQVAENDIQAGVRKLTPLIKSCINLSSIASLGSKNGIFQLISKVCGLSKGQLIQTVMQFLGDNGLAVLVELCKQL